MLDKTISENKPLVVVHQGGNFVVRVCGNAAHRINEVAQAIFQFIKNRIWNRENSIPADKQIAVIPANKQVVRSPGVLQNIMVQAAVLLEEGEKTDPIVEAVFQCAAFGADRLLALPGGDAMLKMLSISKEAVQDQIQGAFKGSSAEQWMTEWSERGYQFARKRVKGAVDAGIALGLRFAAPGAGLVDKQIEKVVDKGCGSHKGLKAFWRAVAEQWIVPKAAEKLAQGMDVLSEEWTDKAMEYGKSAVIVPIQAKAWAVLLPFAGPLVGAGALILVGGKKQSRYELAARVTAGVALMYFGGPFLPLAIVYGQRFGSHALEFGKLYSKHYRGLKNDAEKGAAEEEQKSMIGAVTVVATNVIFPGAGEAVTIASVAMRAVLIVDESVQPGPKETGLLRFVADMLSPLAVTKEVPSSVIVEEARVEKPLEQVQKKVQVAASIFDPILVDDDMLSSSEEPDRWFKGAA